MHRRQSGGLGTPSRPVSTKTNYPTRNSVGEPSSKRQKIADSSPPYVKIDSMGVVSPIFVPLVEKEPVIIRSGPTKRPISNQSRPDRSSEPSPLALSEYQDIERIMQSGPLRRDLPLETSPYFPEKRSNGIRQRSESSDPEAFTRESKKARHRKHSNDPSDSPHEPNDHTEVSHSIPDDGDTPTPVKEIFKSVKLPSGKQIRAHEERERSEISSKAESGSAHMERQTISAMEETTQPHLSGTEKRGSRTAAKSAAGKPIKAKLKSAEKADGRFVLRYLNYGLLPDDRSYIVVISDDHLRIYDDKSLLSDEPLWCPISLNKILKILHGEDCLKIILHMSQCQGQPPSKMLLELNSREDRASFLSLMPTSDKKTLMMSRDEYVYTLHYTPTDDLHCSPTVITCANVSSNKVDW